MGGKRKEERSGFDFTLRPLLSSLPPLPFWCPVQPQVKDLLEKGGREARSRARQTKRREGKYFVIVLIYVSRAILCSTSRLC